MPKLKPLKNINLNKVCPDVYVHSNIISIHPNGNNLIKTTIKLIDGENLWIKNQKLLDSLYVFFYANETLVYKKLLSALKKSPNEDELYDQFEYQNSSGNLSVRYFCGNDINISGDLVTENIMTNNLLVEAFYQKKNYKFINKNKDLRILNSRDSFKFLVEEKFNEKPIFKKCYISYNKSKRANIGFVFDLEAFLYNNSKSYRFLSYHPRFAKEVLKNSRIVQNATFFYKKNISVPDSEYIKINSRVSIRKFSSDPMNQKHLIGTTDLGNAVENNNIFKLKITGRIIDFSQFLLKEKFINNFDLIKSFISKYINELDRTKLNKEIKNYREHFFINTYKNYFSGSVRNEESEIVQIIDILSEMYSFTTGIDVTRYQALFTSLLNPLTYEEGVLEKIIFEIEKLQKYYRNLFYENRLNDYGDEIGINNKELEFDIELQDKIDYNYDPRYGFDVITPEQYNYDSAEKYFGLKLLTQSEKKSRNSFELAKYSSGTSDASSIKYLSISSILLGASNHYLLNIQNILSSYVYNEIIAKINNFNTGISEYDFVESLYSQLIKKNIYIKTIGHGKNNSKSTLFKNLIFDRNINSKEESKDIIYGLGIDDIYNISIENRYNSVSEFFKAYFKKDKPLVSIKNYSLQDSKKNIIPIVYSENTVPETKSANILLYNNFFEDKLLEDGDVCSLFHLQPALVNDIFMQKMCFFNQYYIVEKLTKPMEQQEEKQYLFKDELKKYNIIPISLSRDVQEYNINNMLGQI